MKIVKRKKVNFNKMFRLLGITLVLVLTMVFAIKTPASGSPQNTSVEITVCPGDTLWEIAKKYAPEEDARESVFEIMNLNKMEGSDIYTGQKLKIPLK